MKGLIEDFSAKIPFQLDPFQVEAMQALADGQSVLVAAPTGTGKTVIAEFAVWLSLSRGLRALYTTPIKALSNQKFRDFSSRYVDQVGLMTGDLVENPSGRLLVMTTEVARNMLVQDPGAFQDVGCLVFDEVHYLADPERGTAWEESILLAPPTVPLVCLSATVANADEVADWIRTTGREVALIQSSHRAVPLKHRYYLDGKLHPVLNGRRSLPNTLKQQSPEHSKRRKPHGNGRRGSHRHLDSDELSDPADVVTALAEANLLPAIYFLFSRRAVEVAAESCRRLSLLSNQEAMEVRQLARRQVEVLPPEDHRLDQLQRLLALLPRGIGFHHSGLLPPLKTLVEELLASGKLKIVFATDTLALGINVPARSVVVGDMVKFDGQTRRPITPGEYRQLTGRAGRRGMDTVGYSILLHSPLVGLDRALEIANGDVAPLESAFRPSYSTVLNLWQRPEDEERLAQLIAGSLRQFHQVSQIRSLAEERDMLASTLEGLPAGCLRDGGTINWLEREKLLKRELGRAESALERAVKQSAAVARTGKLENVAAAESKIVAARERYQETSAALAQSPCRSCHLRPTHRRSEREKRSFTGLLVGVDRDLEVARRESRRRAKKTLRALRSILESLGYLADGNPKPKAKVLMRLFGSNSLTIAELLDCGVLADASAAEVAEVASWFAFDKDGAGKSLSLTPRLARIRATAEAICKKLLEMEHRCGLDLSSPLSTEFKGVGLAWATGTSLGELSERSGLAEGDLVFALQKSIDLCRQIGQAAAFSRTPSLRQKAVEAEKLLRRGVVDSYYRWVVGLNEVASS
ncbi:MAG: DEAD/DEAH box helicase [Chloroflexota bacterium]